MKQIGNTLVIDFLMHFSDTEFKLTLAPVRRREPGTWKWPGGRGLRPKRKEKVTLQHAQGVGRPEEARHRSQPLLLERRRGPKVEHTRWTGRHP